MEGKLSRVVLVHHLTSSSSSFLSSLFLIKNRLQSAAISMSSYYHHDSLLLVFESVGRAIASFRRKNFIILLLTPHTHFNLIQRCGFTTLSLFYCLSHSLSLVAHCPKSLRPHSQVSKNEANRASPRLTSNADAGIVSNRADQGNVGAFLTSAGRLNEALSLFSAAINLGPRSCTSPLAPLI